MVDSSHSLDRSWGMDNWQGMGWKKNRTKQRHTFDSMLFRTFVWIWTWCKDLSAVLFICHTCLISCWPRCGTLWRCGELSQESSEWWCLVRCHLWFSLEHFWFTDSLGLNLCQNYSCAQAITNEVRLLPMRCGLVRLVTVTCVHKLVTFILVRSWPPCSIWHIPSSSML